MIRLHRPFDRPPPAVAVDMLADLRADGYTPGPPPGAAPAMIAVDYTVCRRAKCPHCGARGLLAYPMHRGTSYRVIAVCPSCGEGTEF